MAAPSSPEVDSVAASSDDRLLLAATNARLYRSSDGGATWAPSASLTGQILALAVDPVDSANAYSVVLTSSIFGAPASPFTSYTFLRLWQFSPPKGVYRLNLRGAFKDR